MPLYATRCDAGHEGERFIRLSKFNEPMEPCECGELTWRVISAPQIMSDLAPYQAMGIDVETGKAPMITSRSHHRDYLKRNNYAEVGNEKQSPTGPVHATKADIARDVKRAIEQTGARL
jgi:hypothetical protein